MKYSKIDIRNTVRNLIDYFKMQNEVPSQKEIVEVWSKIKEGVEKNDIYLWQLLLQLLL